MALEEYKRKRRFESTPEPAPKVAAKRGNRFVVQKHRASRLHYDFRLEMDGVLKSWAVPRGPSLDPADKRLAMMVEDHPVSYFDFEGTIPEGNYGAGTVMVWDVGTWQALSPQLVEGKYVKASDAEAAAMLAKGDLKFRLSGTRVKGDFALVHIKSRRDGSKGNEWLLIKKKDDEVVEKFDAEQYETSVLTKRTMSEIGGDEGSAEWTSSRPATRGKLKAPWLAAALARVEKKKADSEGKGKTPGGRATATVKKIPRGRKPVAKETSKTAPLPRKQTASTKKKRPAGDSNDAPAGEEGPRSSPSAGFRRPDQLPNQRRNEFPGTKRALMPKVVHPMLAITVESAFDDPKWLFEIKWDGYRAVLFVENGAVRLVSRNQIDLTAKFPELKDLALQIDARQAVLDGEIVALDEQGLPSFSLLQQRTGFRPGKPRVVSRSEVGVVYYAFDLIHLDGHDLHRVTLEQRKQALRGILKEGNLLRFSDHYPEHGVRLLEGARGQGLEGIVAKKLGSIYEEARSTEWRKIKITHTVDCVVGGYTEPQGSRQYFGSLVLGQYDKSGKLIHVGQAGTGFDQKLLKQIYGELAKIRAARSPFEGLVDALGTVHFVKPRLVAEIKFAEWTHETAEGRAKLRAPVFLRMRPDKDPAECALVEKRAKDHRPGSA